MHLILIMNCLLNLWQNASPKDRSYCGQLNKHARVDLILVDMPEGLPVIGVSESKFSIPLWNTLPESWLQPVFDFADMHLHDDGAFIILHPQSMEAKKTIIQHTKAYSFQKKLDSWDINKLFLTNPANPNIGGENLQPFLYYFLK